LSCKPKRLSKNHEEKSKKVEEKFNGLFKKSTFGKLYKIEFGISRFCGMFRQPNEEFKFSNLPTFPTKDGFLL
jgi:hypothetical protein